MARVRVMGDEPRLSIATRDVESPRVAPDLGEDFLNDVLRVAFIAQNAKGD